VPRLQLAYFKSKLPMAREVVDALFARIPGDLDRFERELPVGLRREVGTVVYQPLEYRRALVEAFRSGDERRIAAATGFLSHYCADLHVPLHTTIDHAGTFSASFAAATRGRDRDIHSRFETGLLKYLGPAMRSMASRHLGPVRPADPGTLTARAVREAREAYEMIAVVVGSDARWFSGHKGAQVQWRRYYAAVQKEMAPIAALQMARSAQMIADVIVSAWQESRQGSRQASPRNP
jgi:hypothetical protein